MARIHGKQIAVVSLRDEYDIAAAEELAPYLHFRSFEADPYPGDRRIIILTRSWAKVVWFVVNWRSSLLRDYPRRRTPQDIPELTEQAIRHQVARARKYYPSIDKEDF